MTNIVEQELLGQSQLDQGFLQQTLDRIVERNVDFADLYFSIEST